MLMMKTITVLFYLTICYLPGSISGKALWIILILYHSLVVHISEDLMESTSYVGWGKTVFLEALLHYNSENLF